MNPHNLQPLTDPRVLFIDMNSFFASCEQQVNYWLRGRPVGVCVYTGKYGCVISPSIEAKLKGVKTGMRLNEAMELCPDLVPLETHPDRYRDFHIKIIAVLKKYSDEVIPKSIDEAIVNLTNYKLIYKDPVKLALRIKEDIKKEVGEWFQCSIGIAPNAFLAKLGSGLQKPSGLTVIAHDSIDGILKKLSLTDLPGIGKQMAARLQKAGINTPLELRYSGPEKVRAACKSVVGFYWHCRLNFIEVDMTDNVNYKSMQAMRQISAQKRQSPEFLNDLLLSLCMTLETRMMKQEVFCNGVDINIQYEDNSGWKNHIQLDKPTQDGIELLHLLKQRMQHFQLTYKSNPILNNKVTALGVNVSNLIASDKIQYSLFENNLQKNKLRKIVYSLKDKFGDDKLMKAAELQNIPAMKDAIGFGSVKDIH